MLLVDSILLLLSASHITHLHSIMSLASSGVVAQYLPGYRFLHMASVTKSDSPSTHLDIYQYKSQATILVICSMHKLRLLHSPHVLVEKGAALCLPRSGAAAPSPPNVAPGFISTVPG